jgi:uncharacterized protein
MESTPPPGPDANAREEQDIRELQDRLDRVPAPLQPLDVSAIDGFLCGVLLQPGRIDPAQWQRWITDVDGRALPAGFDAARIHRLVQQRHATLQAAIGARQWFDPWIFELDGAATVSECVLPWAAGFAAAIERFPGLSRLDDAQLLEPLALIYLHFDADDLDDADALLQLIDTLEPPADLAEAVQDVVRSVMLLADVSRPLDPAPAPAAAPRRRPAARRR